MSKKTDKGEKKHTVREAVEVQHQFDAGEYKSKSETLAQLLADVDLKEESVKAQAATAKAEIKAMQSEVSELANQLRLGVENRTVQADVEFSWGATEVKAADRLVDAIVELTETGSSLKANNLRIVDTLTTSYPQLIANRKAWQDAWKKKKIQMHCFFSSSSAASCRCLRRLRCRRSC